MTKDDLEECIWKESADKIKEIEKRITEDRTQWMQCYVCNGHNTYCKTYNPKKVKYENK